MLGSLFNKVSRNKETPAQLFSCELCKASNNTLFYRKPSIELEFFLKRFYIVDAQKKVFEWLAINEFLFNSKN